MYINQHVASLIDMQPYPAHRMSRVNMGIAENLREQMTIQNNAFA